MKTVANRIAASDFQLNTHAIGDSANTVILKVYKEALKEKKDRRWKIEHAQVIQEADFDYFKLGLFHPFSLHMRLQICIGQVKG
jgi:predicted amidohydrolase YtcJ